MHPALYLLISLPLLVFPELHQLHLNFHNQFLARLEVKCASRQVTGLDESSSGPELAYLFQPVGITLRHSSRPRNRTGQILH